jgi:hypothetical protein
MLNSWIWLTDAEDIAFSNGSWRNPSFAHDQAVF